MLAEFLGPHDILFPIRAVSLRFRDVAMLHEGRYPAPAEPGGIPASDCVAEVVEVEDRVKQFGERDPVVPTCNLAHSTGEDGGGSA